MYPMRHLITLTIALGAALWGGAGEALTPGQKAALFSVASSWVLPPAVHGVDLDFANNRYWLKDASGSLSVSRASVGTAVNALGNWTSFPSNTLRRTNLGVTIEEGRTNSIRNNTMVGATGSTWPTNWSYAPAGTITATPRAPFVFFGFTWIPVSIFGTANASGVAYVQFEGTQIAAATYGQTWNASVYLYASGTLPTINIAITNRNSAGVTLSGANSIVGAATSSPTRINISFTPIDATTAYVTSRFYFNVINGQSYNGTVNIAVPQMELNTLINSTVASAAVNASGSGGVNGSAVYSVGDGTGTAATLNCTWSGGVLTVNSVASAGSYTVFPTSPSALTYVSGAATGWTGASVNLTPTNNAAAAFATTPILTSGSALARAADVITLPIRPMLAYSLYAIGTPEDPTSYTQGQAVASVNDGTANNCVQLSRSSATGGVATSITAGGVAQTVPTVSGTWARSTQAKVLTFINVAGGQMKFNSTLGSLSTTPITMPTPTQLSIGVRGIGDMSFNGVISRIAVAPTSMLAY